MNMTLRRKRLSRPTHPGEFIREDFLPDYDLSVADLAEAIKVSRQTVNELINEKRALSAAMALRLSRFFGNSPEFWLNAHLRELDLWEAETMRLHKTTPKPPQRAQANQAHFLQATPPSGAHLQPPHRHPPNQRRRPKKRTTVPRAPVPTPKTPPIPVDLTPARDPAVEVIHAYNAWAQRPRRRPRPQAAPPHSPTAPTTCALTF